jgi:hypothetical protein
MGGIEFLPFKQAMDGKQGADKLKSGSNVASASGSKVLIPSVTFVFIRKC